MTDRSSRGTRRTGSFLPHYGEMLEKWAARGCKRPKSREETPKEGGDNAKESRYRAATICQCDAQKARGIDLSSQPRCRPAAAGSGQARIGLLAGIPARILARILARDRALRHRPAWRTARTLPAERRSADTRRAIGARLRRKDVDG